MPSRHTPEQQAAAVTEALTAIELDSLSANEAARRIGERYGVTGRCISKWAAKHGTPLPTRSRERTKQATADLTAQYEARRATLRTKFLDAAEQALNRIQEPHYEWKTVDKRLVRAEYDRAPSGATKDYVTAAAIAIDKIRLEEGKATGRHEIRDLTAAEQTVDAEIQRLETELGRNDPKKSDAPS